MTRPGKSLILALSLAAPVAAQAQGDLSLPYAESLPQVAACVTPGGSLDSRVEALTGAGWTLVPKDEVQMIQMRALAWELYVEETRATNPQGMTEPVANRDLFLSAAQVAYDTVTAPDSADQSFRYFRDGAGGELLLAELTARKTVLCKVALPAGAAAGIEALAFQQRDGEFTTPPQSYTLNLPNKDLDGAVAFARITLMNPSAIVTDEQLKPIPDVFLSLGHQSTE